MRSCVTPRRLLTSSGDPHWLESSNFNLATRRSFVCLSFSLWALLVGKAPSWKQVLVSAQASCKLSSRRARLEDDPPGGPNRAIRPAFDRESRDLWAQLVLLLERQMRSRSPNRPAAAEQMTNDERKCAETNGCPRGGGGGLAGACVRPVAAIDRPSRRWARSASRGAMPQLGCCNKLSCRSDHWPMATCLIAGAASLTIDSRRR